MHWALFVEAFNITLQITISRSHLEQMQQLIQQFLILSEEYYSKQTATYNQHQLLHWLKSIVNWRPPRAHTGFVFESGNGRLLNTINAAKGITPQITRLIGMQRSSTILRNHVFPYSAARVKNFLIDLENTSTQKTCKIFKTRYFGAPTQLQDNWIQELTLSNDAVYYKRMVRDGFLYSPANIKSYRSNNSFSKLETDQFVHIYQFIVDESSGIEITVCRILKTENMFRDQCPSLQLIKSRDSNFTPIETNLIERVCVFIVVKGIEYILSVPHNNYI